MEPFNIAANQIPVDVLGSYLKGRQTAMQMQAAQNQLALAPLQLQAAQQSVDENGLKIDQLRTALGDQQKIRSLLANQGASSGGGAQSVGQSSGGIQNGPQASGGEYDPSRYQLPETPRFGLSAETTAAILPLTGGTDIVKQYREQYEEELKRRESAVKERQLEASGPVSFLDDLYNRPNPAAIVRLNHSLLAQWDRLAPQLNMDPIKDLTDENVRSVIPLIANGIRSQVQLAPKEYGFTGNLSAGQTHYQGGRPTITAPQEPMTEYQREELKREDLRIRNQEKQNDQAEVRSRQAEDRTIANMRKEFRSLQSVKDYEATLPLIKSAEKAPDTGYGDLQLIYTAGKILDPGSVVREGELDLAIKAGSPMERVIGATRFTAGKGGRLTPTTRQQILSMLNERVGAYRKAYDQDYATYYQYAQGSRLDPNVIVGKRADEAYGPSDNGGGGTVTLYKNGVPHAIPADKADDARKNYGYKDKP